ncbi:MAG: LytTR family DNA-binding domain-containing protein [Bacteroidota bacterium]
MKCIIIDDEPLAINVLISYCEDMGGIEVVGTYSNAVDAFTALQSNQVDLVFIDIEMPQINGIDFIRSLDKRPLFIFTTAYPQYALEGFDLNAVDYLVKPIPFPRFIKAIGRVRELLYLKNRPQVKTHVAPAFGMDSVEKKRYIFVKSEYDNKMILLNNITFIQGLKDYLKIHTDLQSPILTLMSFKAIQEILPAMEFFRVHRSYIVNVNRIDSIQRSKIVVGETRIPIGESYRNEFFEKIGL